MTKENCLSINGLNAKQVAVIKRWFWSAQKNNKPCKLEACETPEQVIELVNASFKRTTDETAAPAPRAFSLEALTIEELSDLLEQIPGIIEDKKRAQIADIDAQIAQLKELKKELTK